MNQYPVRDLVLQLIELQQLEPIMASQATNGIHLDRVHAGAICEEIGEALHATLTGPSRLPPHLLRLTERFDRVDRGDVVVKASTGIGAR